MSYLIWVKVETKIPGSFNQP